MNSRRCMSAPKLRRRIVSAQTSALIGAETGIKTIAAVHSQCRLWVDCVAKVESCRATNFSRKPETGSTRHSNDLNRVTEVAVSLT